MTDETPFCTAQSIFAINTLNHDENTEFPLNMQQIAISQKDDEVLQRRRSNSKYDNKFSSTVIDGNVLTTFDGKVWVPQLLQQRIIDWYHNNLQHAGVTRMIATIGQIFVWPGLRPMVEKHVATCDSCQRNKQSNKKQYGKLPLVSALRNKNPWERVHVDCGGPWKIRFTKGETGTITSFDVHLLAIVDACTKWTEFVRIDSASSIATAKAFDREWLCRYPRPSECCHDNGNEFVGIEFQELLDSYGIKSKLTTVKNPQANAIVERTFGVLGEQLRASIFQSDWSSYVDMLVQACAFAIRTTTPAQGLYSPAQLAFGYDMLFRQKIFIDWERFKALHNKQALQNNTKENKKRLEHQYHVGDKVLLLLKPYERQKRPKISPTTQSRGPFTILEIFENGTVKIECGAYTDVVSIRRITPYLSRE